MPPSPRKIAFPNPFYVLLVIVSTLFAVTAFGYLVSPNVLQRAQSDPAKAPGPGSRALALWLDQRGPAVLGVEFTVMLIAGVLAMSTDHWFSAKKTPPKADPKVGAPS
jgi:hypothetical protein